jgi:hypothetical protein
VPLPELTFRPLAGDLAALVAQVPAAAGVGQLRGPGNHNLVLAPAGNLRKWAADHLGVGKPPPPGRRPRTNLAGVATSLGWACTASPFGQRLLYERLIAPLVPLSRRRDLKPPAFLHIDPADRFPRVTVREGDGAAPALYGPFRHRRAAEEARDAVNRLFPLRPCDAVFEPEPALPLGLGCLYAQVRSCAAPCLSRIGEEDYRALAVRVASWLAEPGTRVGAPAVVPPTVEAVSQARAVVVGVGRREVELYPVCSGRVLEEAAVVTTAEGLEAAVAGLEWPQAHGPDDWPWLAAWITSARGRASYVSLRVRGGLVQALRAALPERFAPSAPGDNVGASQGEA